MAANVYLLCVLPCLSLSVSLSPLSSEVHCLLSSVEVEMIGQWRSLDWWERTPGTLLGLVLQSHFIFIAEQGARVVDVFVLGQLFGTARRCARYFICPVEEGVVHLKKTQNWLQYDVYLLYNRNRCWHMVQLEVGPRPLWGTTGRRRLIWAKVLEH